MSLSIGHKDDDLSEILVSGVWSFKLPFGFVISLSGPGLTLAIGRCGDISDDLI